MVARLVEAGLFDGGAAGPVAGDIRIGIDDVHGPLDHRGGHGGGAGILLRSFPLRRATGGVACLGRVAVGGVTELPGGELVEGLARLWGCRPRRLNVHHLALVQLQGRQG